MREAGCDTCNKKYGTHDAVFLGYFLLSSIFFGKSWYSLVGRSYLKANNIFPFH